MFALKEFGGPVISKKRVEVTMNHYIQKPRRRSTTLQDISQQ
jgi:hypothetical protein